MQNFDLNKTNLFMRICLRFEQQQDEKVIFLYSNEKGMEHLNKILNESPLFANLLTPEEILIKMKGELAYQFAGNEYTGINSREWIGKRIALMPEELDDFNQTFVAWKKQLGNLLGKDNIFEVHMPGKELKEFESSIDNNQISHAIKDEKLLRFIESYRLSLSLNQSLTTNETTKRKNKL